VTFYFAQIQVASGRDQCLEGNATSWLRPLKYSLNEAYAAAITRAVKDAAGAWHKFMSSE